MPISRIKLVKSQQQWNITDYSWVHRVLQTERKAIASPIFLIADYQWQFKLRREEKDERKVSVFLVLRGPPVKKLPVAKCRVTFVRSNSCMLNENWVAFNDKKEAHVMLLDDRDVLHEAALAKDQITLILSLEVASADENKPPGETAQEALDNSVDIAVEAPQLPFTLKHLLDDAQSTGAGDVRITVDGATLSAHQCILANRSPVLKQMFDQSSNAAAAGASQVYTLDLATVPRSVVEAFLTFIYSDNCDLDKSWTPVDAFVNAVHLLVLSDRFQTSRLRTICEKFLSNYLTKETVVHLLELAESYQANQLKRKCIAWIIDNDMQRVFEDDYQKLVIARPVLALEYTKALTQHVAPPGPTNTQD